MVKQRGDMREFVLWVVDDIEALGYLLVQAHFCLRVEVQIAGVILELQTSKR